MTSLATETEVQHRGEPGARGDLARRAFGSPSLRLVGRRLLVAIPVLWGVTLLTYMVMNLLPGDTANILLGVNATPAEIHQLDAKLHLNEPFWVRYWHWFTGLLHGDLGTSLSSNQSVASVLGSRLPATMELLAYAFVVSLLLAIVVAVFAARRPNGIFDRLSLAVSMVGLSAAPFVIAPILIYLFAVQQHWFLFPANDLGSTPVSYLKGLTMPAACIGIPIFAIYTRLLRADIVEQMQREDYVVTARAKGIGPWRVLIRHATRNSMFNLITLVALNLGTLVGAVVIIETIFSVPGVGSYLITSIQDHDIPMIEGIVIIIAVITVLANLLADVLYAVLDPRIRYGRSTS